MVSKGPVAWPLIKEVRSILLPKWPDLKSEINDLKKEEMEARCISSNQRRKPAYHSKSVMMRIW